MVSYVLAGFRKGDRKAAEGSLKYVIYGGVASGVMLFGMSYLYGLTGTTSLLELGAAARRRSQAAMAVVASPRRAHRARRRDRLRPRRASATRSRRCRGTCGARTCTRARRRRSPRSSRSARRRPGFALAIRLFYAAFAGPPAPATGFAEALAGHPLAGGRRRALRGHDDARQPHRARADQPEAAPRVLVDRARGLHAHGPRRGLATSGTQARHDLHARLPRDEPRRVPRRHPRRARRPAPSRSSTTAGSSQRAPARRGGVRDLPLLAHGPPAVRRVRRQVVPVLRGVRADRRARAAAGTRCSRSSARSTPRCRSTTTCGSSGRCSSTRRTRGAPADRAARRATSSCSAPSPSRSWSSALWWTPIVSWTRGVAAAASAGSRIRSPAGTVAARPVRPAGRALLGRPRRRAHPRSPGLMRFRAAAPRAARAPPRSS